MMKAEVEFDNNKKGRHERARFKDRCEKPDFVCECLRKYQRWRKGVGEYECSGDPEREMPPPFSPEALSIVEDAAIEMLERLSKETPQLSGNMTQWFADLIKREISETDSAAAVEHTWALGADSPETATMHENNSEELKQYSDFMKGLYGKYVG